MSVDTNRNDFSANGFQLQFFYYKHQILLLLISLKHLFINGIAINYITNIVIYYNIIIKFLEVLLLIL